MFVFYVQVMLRTIFKLNLNNFVKIQVTRIYFDFTNWKFVILYSEQNEESIGFKMMFLEYYYFYYFFEKTFFEDVKLRISISYRNDI